MGPTYSKAKGHDDDKYRKGHSYTMNGSCALYSPNPSLHVLVQGTQGTMPGFFLQPFVTVGKLLVHGSAKLGKMVAQFVWQ